jgi:ABC-type protease/lipase transport system fused ATPase/permease subunit
LGSAFIVHESSCLRLLGGGPAASYWERRTAAMEPPTEAKDDPMNWLLLKPIRPFITLAALASLLLNLALVVPSLYMLQVFDRVFSSRSIETLVMLGLFALLALGLGFCMDRWPPR